MADRKDPFLSFNFRVEVDQKVLAGFQEASGLDVETNLESFREGGENRYEQQIPGPAKFPSRLVFKRGMTDTSELWTWYQEVIQGLIKRKTVAVFLCDSAGNDRHKWVFRGAVPVKLVGPQLKANASEVALESLELVHKGLLPY